MPKTFWESVLFTAIMATCMVFIMSGYNNILHAEGFNFGLIIPDSAKFFNELFVAYPLALLFTGRIVPPVINKLVPPQKAWLKLLLIPCGISMIMAPLMTTYVQIRNLGISQISPRFLLHGIMMNILFAYAVQVLFLGPLVRFIFQKVITFKSYMNAWIVKTFSGAVPELLMKVAVILNGGWCIANIFMQ